MICSTCSPFYVPAAASTDDISSELHDALQPYGLVQPAQQAFVDKSLPYYAGIAKMHKSPPATRFLSCSHDTMLTPTAQSLTHLFRGMQSDLHTLWQRQLERVPAFAEHSTNQAWFMGSSQHLMPMLFQFTASQPSWLQFEASGGFRTYDFERLYTNIDQQDLKQKMHSLFDSVFALHPQRPSVYASADKHESLDWKAQQSQPRVHTAGGTSKRVKGCTFTLQSAKHLFDILIDNAYVQFGDSTYHQVKGIPMGTNPAVYIANYYLYMYEIDFLRRLIDLHVHLTPPPHTASSPALQLWSSFRFTRRYVDDLITTAGVFLPDLMYTSQTWGPHHIQGIYPNTLKLEQAQQGFDVPFMDVLVMGRESEHSPAVQVATRLYDKRRTAAYDKINIIRMPHITSQLSIRCKYGILISQFHRFQRIITEAANFQKEIANLILTLLLKGYNLTRMMRVLKRLLHRHQGRYHGDGSPQFFDAIMLVLFQLALDNIRQPDVDQSVVNKLMEFIITTCLRGLL